jgi:hypothetical protein
MRKHARMPYKVPNPHPVQTNFQGHYATVSHKQREAWGDGLDAYITTKQNGAGIWRPNLVGIQHRLRWCDMEPTFATSQTFGAPGYTYDFSLASHLLKECAGDGTAVHSCSGANGRVQMVAMIEDKAYYSAAEPVNDYYPPYLLTVSGGPYASPPSTAGNGGSDSFRSDPYVSDRWCKLVKAMASWRDSYLPNGFDAHPNFEGITIQESAIGQGGSDNDPNYSAARYTTAIQAMINQVVVSFQKSRCVWFMNFILGNNNAMDTILGSIVGTGATFGGPDCLHDRFTLNNVNTAGTAPGPYQWYDKYASQLDCGPSMQNDSYREVKSTGPTVYYSMEEQFYLAASYVNPATGVVETTNPPPAGVLHKLQGDRVFWDFRPASGAENDWSDAARVIDAHPEFNSPAIKKF